MLYYPKLEYHLLSKKRRKVRIYLILRLHLRKKFEAPLPLFINPSFWDAKKEQVKLHYKDSYEINNKLLIVKDQLEKMLLREKRMEIFKECLNFLDTRVTLDQNGFKFDIFEH